MCKKKKNTFPAKNSLTPDEQAMEGRNLLEEPLLISNETRIKIVGVISFQDFYRRSKDEM